MKKKLVVCGCSWSSRDLNYPDTEFGYFVSQHFDWDYQNIAVVGNPNWGIRMQLDHAIKNLKADYIILNWTTSCRMLVNHTGKDYKYSDGLGALDYDVDSFFTNELNHPEFPNEPKIIGQSINGLIYAEDITADWETVKQFWPWATHYLTEKKFNVLRDYYIHVYDDNIEAQNQYYMMQGAVHQLEQANIPYLMSPNTFRWLQTKQDTQNLTWEEDQDKIYMDEFIFDFVPEKNLITKGIADALQWDLERNPNSIEHPDHNHCHHLSEWAQKRWATEIAIPKFEELLKVESN